MSGSQFDHIHSPSRIYIGGALAFQVGDPVPIATANLYGVPYQAGDVHVGTGPGYVPDLSPLGDYATDAELAAATAPNSDAVALRRWFTAVAGRNNAPANYFFLGDSIIEQTRGGANEALRIPSMLRDQLQQRLMGSVQGAGHIPASHYNVASAWTHTGTNPTDSVVFGIGKMATILTAGSNSTETITVDCDRFLILGLGGSTGTVKIDGGAAAPLIVTAAGTDGRIVFDSGPIAAGSHVVACAAPASGTHFYLESIVVCKGDYASGVRKWESANSNSKALYLLPSGYGGPSVLEPSTTVPYWAHAMDVMKPDLVMPLFGINEQLIAPTRTPAQFQVDLTNLISVINVQTPGPDVSVLPIIMWAHGFNSQTEAVWLPYRAAIKEAAAANGWAKPVDLYDSVGYIGATDPYAVTSDLIHASAKGKQLIVDEIIRRVA